MMDEENAIKIAPVSETEGMPSVSNDSVMQLIEQLPPEKLLDIIQQMENKKRQALEQELKTIENQIAELSAKATEIRQKLGLNIKTRATRTGNGDFLLDGVPMSGSAIAKSFGLETYGINWRLKLLSILSGNSGGLPLNIADEIRRRVRYTGSP